MHHGLQDVFFDGLRPWCSSPLLDDAQHLAVDAAVGGDDELAREAIEAALEIGRLSTGLPHQEYPRRHVPRLEANLPEAVEPPAGNVGQVERGSPSPAHTLAAAQEMVESLDVVVGGRAAVVGETGGQERALQMLDAGDADGLTVEGRPTPAVAAKTSPRNGSWITPTTTFPSTSNASAMPT